MGRNTGVAAGALAGAAIGNAIGSEIGNSLKIRNFRKKMVDEIMEDFGALTAIETVSYWVQQDGSTSFDFRAYADKQVQNRMYRDIENVYGESAADFFEFRIQKCLEKGLPLKLNEDLLGYLNEKGIQQKGPIDFSSYNEKLYNQKSENSNLRGMLLKLGKSPTIFRSVGITIALIVWLFLLFTVFNMGLDLQGSIIGFGIATLTVAWGGRKILRKIVEKKLTEQFEKVTELYGKLQKEFYQKLNGLS